MQVMMKIVLASKTTKPELVTKAQKSIRTKGCVNQVYRLVSKANGAVVSVRFSLQVNHVMAKTMTVTGL